MAGTNPAKPPVDDDDKPVTEEDLHDLKYPKDDVDTSPTGDEDEPPEGDEPAGNPDEPAGDDDQIVPDPASDDDKPEGDEPPTPPAFVKEFDYIKGDTPEEYAKNLEVAYKNSTTEAMRLKGELDEAQKAPPVTQPPADDKTPIGETPPATPATPKSPTDLYVQQKLDEEIYSAFEVTKKEYPQVSDPAEYAKFTREVQIFSRTIMETQGRLASPAELYGKAAVSLGWEKKATEPDEKDKLGMATKNSAGTSRSAAAPAKPKPVGKQVSPKMLAMNRKFYPGKTDAEIIEELTPYL